MNFGIVSMYPFRPHVQDLVYLSDQLENAGHKCSYLVCNSALPTCYYNLFNGKVKSKKQCFKCKIGGLFSYIDKNKIYNIDDKRKSSLNNKDIEYLLKSTIGTLGRIENSSEIKNVLDKKTENKLEEAVNIVYKNTIDWVNNENIDSVLVFNGRLDVTKAITLGLERINIPFITVENHVNGLTLNYNEDCLSLDFINRINSEFKNQYLNKEQAEFAGDIVGKMFQKKQKLWRTHNVTNSNSDWPIENTETKKVLITPSSKYEFLGNEDWKVKWTSDYTEGYTKVIKALDVNFSDCVLRCHPFWDENLGHIGDGSSSEMHYTKWAKEYGIKVIKSSNDANTLDLIDEADIILVNGGTAGIEAAILGKKVISVGKSRYYNAGFTTNVFNDTDLDNIRNNKFDLDSSVIQKKVLRYLYNYHARFEQFYDLISKKTPLKNIYLDSKFIEESIVRYFKNECIEPYTLKSCTTKKFEDNIIKLINKKDWASLILNNESKKYENSYMIKKRGILKFVDYIRDKLPAGHY